MTTQTPAQLIAAAADLVEQRGHAQRCDVDSDGSISAIWAIRLADTEDRSVHTSLRVSFQAIRLLDAEVTRNGRWRSAGHWDDHTDGREVVATMRRLAERIGP